MDERKKLVTRALGPEISAESTGGTEREQRETTDTTRLHGRPLVLARVGWVGAVALAMFPFLLSLPDIFAEMRHPSPSNAALSPGAVHALARAGISLDFYAWANLVVVCMAVLLALILALVLFWRRSDDWMALGVSAFFIYDVTINVGVAHNGPTSNPSTISAILLTLAGVPGFIVILGVVLLFPTGRFAPRWSRQFLLLTTVWAIARGLFPTLLGGVLFAGYPLIVGLVVVCVVYRYRRVSTPPQRQQTKWVIAGFVAILIANQAFWLPQIFTSLGQTLYAPLGYLAYELIILVSPVTCFIAIQRYRLYDIDVIIRRTLIYGTLTAILAGVYFGVVLGVQTVARHLTGQTGQQPIVIVATTLLIAVLFTPLRRRIQAGIDRAFYRSAYDAGRTLSAFGAKLRTETDLGELREHLVEVVQQTMQPAHASLWLAGVPHGDQRDGRQNPRPSRMSDAAE